MVLMTMTMILDDNIFAYLFHLISFPLYQHPSAVKGNARITLLHGQHLWESLRNVEYTTNV